jgi:hypothetical protein
MIFGSTDPGEPIDQAVALAFVLVALLSRWRMTLRPRRLALVRARPA